MKQSINNIRKTRPLHAMLAAVLALLAVALGDRVEQGIESANEHFDRFCGRVESVVQRAEPDSQPQAVVLERPLGKITGLAVCTRADGQRRQ